MHYHSPFDNRTHPERRGNEEFLSNMTLEDFNMCDLPSKRMGITAYAVDATRITYKTTSKQLFPVFVSKEDLEKHSIDVQRKSLFLIKAIYLHSKAQPQTTSQYLQRPQTINHNQSSQQKISPASSLDVLTVCHSTFTNLKESDFKAMQSPSESFLLNLSKHISHWMHSYNLK